MEKFLLNKELIEADIVTCHAGALNTPDNSIESVKAAVDFGARAIEIDVSFRPDGTPVIIHKAKPGEKDGVLLESVFEILEKAKGCLINLDLKSTANLPAIDNLVKKYSLCDRAYYTGVFESWAETVNKNSAIPYYLNCFPSIKEKRSPDLLIEKIKKCGAIGLNTNYHFVTERLIKYLRENSVPVSVWTVNDIRSIRKFKAMNPLNITTRHPEKF